MRQQAPYPAELGSLVGQLAYKPGWSFRLSTLLDRGQGCFGMTLVITISTQHSYRPDETITVAHYMPVPPAAYDRRSWQRWLLDQILLVERHEAMEFFTLVIPGPFIKSDGTETNEYREKPYAPSHGPGNDPYMIREIGTRKDRRTSFRGDLNP